MRPDPTPPMASSPADCTPAFLAGGGEAGRRLRAVDWSASPLGPPSGWPQSLKTIIRVMLDSRYAMWMAWGPSLTFFCNDAYLPTVGRKRDWVLGARSDHVWREIWPDIGPRIDKVLATGEATWDEGLLLFLERSGFPEETYHTFSYSPVYDDDSQVRGMLCVVTEVTERVIGERRLRILRDLAASSLEAKTVDQTCSAMMTTIGQYPFDLPMAALHRVAPHGEAAVLVAATRAFEAAQLPAEWRRDDVATPAAVASALRTGEAGLTETIGKTPIPAGPWPDPIEHFALRPMRAAGHEFLAGLLIVGLSPRRAVDVPYLAFIDLVAKQIAAAIADAEAFAAERARADALAQIDRAKTTFFTNVSHELRTPLTLMMGPLEDALDAPAVRADAPLRTSLEVAQRNSLRLLKLVNTLLDFSRIEADRMRAQFVAVDLAALSTDLASTFRSIIERAGLTLEVDCPPLPAAVHVDRGMWEKVVLNLLSNAFKHTLQGGIRVTVSANATHASLAVSDTGTGIPTAALPQLFDRFFRVTGSQARSHEGTGIGLALARELVGLHGGEIAVNSIEGQGSTFTVSIPFGVAHLPAADVAARDGDSEPAAQARGYLEEAVLWDTLPGGRDTRQASTKVVSSVRRGTVLLADDNADLRNYLCTLLAPQFEVLLAADGVEALEVLALRVPDLVLTDVMMPRLDGFALLKAVRADPRLRGVPVVMISARAGEEARVEGLDAGADDYLVKPFSARELLARVSSQVATMRLRRDSERVSQALNEQLALETEELRSMFEQVPGFTAVLKGPQFVFTMANAAHRELIGDRDVIGRPLLQVLPELAGQQYPALLQQVYETGRPFVGHALPVRLQRRSGEAVEDRFVDFVYQPLRDAGGVVSGVFIQGNDVTERKANEDELRGATARIHALMAAAEIGGWVWFLKEDRFVPDSNIARLYGLAPDDPRTRQSRFYFDQIHPDDTEAVRHANRTAMASGRLDVPEFRIVLPDGSTRWVTGRGRVQFDTDGTPAVLSGLVIDIDRRKRLELELRSADRQKDEFLAMLAHELRNPLAPIRHAGEVLARTAAPHSPAQAAVDIVRRQVMQLTRIVDDLLDVSRITQGRVELVRGPVEVSRLIAQSIETVQPVLMEREHRLDVIAAPQPAWVDADETRIIQCLVNVLTNSIKYSPAASHIRVRASVAVGEVVIAVQDEGFGIAEELLPRVFDLFVQGARSLDRSQGGLGVGLSVVKRLMAMHGGTVSVRSEGVGQGSLVELRLPRIEAPHLEAAPLAERAASARRILVVDDNVDAADSLAMVLEMDGHVVQRAYSGQAALALVGDFQPQVMLLDIGLPDVDGLEVARQIRARPELADVALVALTGYGQAEDRTRSEAAGFDDHLVKPVDLAALENCLQVIRARRSPSHPAPAPSHA